MNLSNQDHTLERKIYIGNIPVIRFIPKEKKEDKYKTIVFYHGWSSNKESQRLRAYILASLGYQVIVPDAINHGERGIVDYLDPSVGVDKFWPTVIENIKEFNKIKKYIVNFLNGDMEKIAVTGNSMGGITAAGILANDDDIKTGVVLNGSCNWTMTNEIFRDMLKIDNDTIFRNIEDSIYDIDPINNLNNLKGKNILLQHGLSDSVVNIKPQISFFNRLNKKDTNVELIRYENLNHFVTTNMMEEMINWFDKYL